MNTSAPWAFSIGIAALIHLAVASTLLSHTEHTTEGARADGDHGLEVGIGLAGSYAELQARSTPPAKPESTPAPRPAPVPAPTLQSVQAPPIAQAATQPAVAAEPKATTTNERDSATTLVEEDAPRKESNRATESPNQRTSDAASTVNQQRATGSGEQRQAGGKAGSARGYFAELSAWLNRHKTYPITAKKEKQEGTVKLQFTIHRNGEISDAQLRASSGHPLLDRAALDMLTAASPVPALPDNLGREQISIVIPIEFSLITNTSFKE